MKILVVEDEIKTLQHICTTISKLFPTWTIVGKARNGQDGMELALTQYPDLVITDIKMSGMNGLDMIRHLTEKKCSAKFVILSGYSDFQFAREALKLGSVDYLLKPFTLDAFKQTLESAEATIRQDQEIRASLPSSFSRQKLFSLILTLQDTARESYLKEYNNRMEADRHFVLLLLKTDHALAKENLENVLNSVFSSCTDYGIEEPSYHYFREQLEILLLFHFQSNIVIIDFLEELKWKLSRKITLPIAYYVSWIRQSEEIQGTLEHMRQQIHWNLSFPESYILHDELISSKTYYPYSYETALEQSLCMHITTKDLKAAKQDLDFFCAAFKKRLYSHVDIRASIFRLTEAVLFTIRSENYSVFEELDYLEILSWTKSRLFLSSFREVIIGIFRQLELFYQKLDSCGNPIVNKAMGIIVSDYSQNLSLETVAERCNVTYEYLSTLFRKELGVKFTTWLTQYRITQAKKLLAQRDKKIYEVSLSCGYEDVHYFCKVFKKQVGMSPTEYIRSLKV